MKRVGLMAELGHATSNDRYGKPHWEVNEVRRLQFTLTIVRNNVICLLDVGYNYPFIGVHSRA